MKTRHISLYIFLLVFFWITGEFFFSDSLLQKEFSGFFIHDYHFYLDKLAQEPGLTSLVSAWLIQLFRWRGVGALINAVILCLTALCLFLTGNKLRKQAFYPTAAILPVLLFCFTPTETECYLQALFLSLLLCVFSLMQKGWQAAIFVILTTPLSTFLLCFPLLIIMVIVMLFIAILRFRSIWCYTALGVSLCIAFVILYLLNSLLTYYPLTERLTEVPSTSLKYGIDVLLFAVGTALAIIPVKGFDKYTKHIERGGLGIIVAFCVSSIFILQSSYVYKVKEYFWRMSHLADKKQWKELLSFIPSEEIKKNRACMAYALLAESGLGTLPDKVFSYPIVSTTMFTLFDGHYSYSHNLNRQFYEQCEIYDMAYTEAFEFGNACSDGSSFGSLRYMVHYSILNEEYETAETYLKILSKSSFHSHYVEVERENIKQYLKRPQQKEKPLFLNTFIKEYPLAIEMQAQLENWDFNLQIYDYALVCSLIDRDLNRFAKILTSSSIYQEKRLPRAYAEAIVMMCAASPEYTEILKDFPIDSKYKTDFIKWCKAAKENDKDTKIAFFGSYWHYYNVTSQLQFTPQTNRNNLTTS